MYVVLVARVEIELAFLVVMVGAEMATKAGKQVSLVGGGGNEGGEEWRYCWLPWFLWWR